MKKLLLLILFIGILLTGCAKLPNPPFGADLTLDQKITAQISNIQTLMKNDKQPNGKYKQRLLTIADGVSYKVDEYEKPDGQVGYWITLQKTVQENTLNATTSKTELINKILTKSIGYGVDADQFTYDWR